MAGVLGVALLTKAAEPLIAAIAWMLSPVVCGLVLILGAALVVASCWEKKC